MPRAFAEITFTPTVKAAQLRYGSREANLGFEHAQDRRDRLGADEAAFIHQRDGFYQATVSENHWPYVQFRGGPAGFLKVLDDRTIGYADFRGNRQYLSVGNLAANSRIALILMDYPNRARLKLWGTARIVHAQDDAETIARLEVPSYRARVERGILITIEAYEWNCPQHITPRYSESELGPLLQRPAPVLGEGPLELVVTGSRALTPQVRSYEFARSDGQPLPTPEPGSHLAVPVSDGEQSWSWRHYSLVTSPLRPGIYEIAVLRQDGGKGGSRALHETFRWGTRIRTRMPENHFSLTTSRQPSILVAGGIGITPLYSMASRLQREGAPFQLHYAARSSHTAPYRDELELLFGDKVTFYDANRRLDLEQLMRQAPPEANFYVCGPERLLQEALERAKALGIDPQRVRWESFQGVASGPAFSVRLQRSGVEFEVGSQQTLVQAAEQHGVEIPTGCRAGVCGTCVVQVVSGKPEHHDRCLQPEQRDQGWLCACVSRAQGPLVLDL